MVVLREVTHMPKVLAKVVHSEKTLPKKTTSSDPVDPGGLGAHLGGLTHDIGQWVADFDPATLSSEELSEEILKFLTVLKRQLLQQGEYAYIARRTALFLCECLSLRLRYGRSEHEVPVEHAAILDAVYNKIQSTRSGIVGDVDVERLTSVIDKGFKALAAHALREVGMSARIPNSALVNEKKILIH